MKCFNVKMPILFTVPRKAEYVPTFHAEISAFKYCMLNDRVLAWRKRATYHTSAESHGGHPPAARSWRSIPDTRDTWEHLGPSCAPVPGNGRIHERPRQTDWCLKAARKNIQTTHGLCPHFVSLAFTSTAIFACMRGKSRIEIRVDRGFFIHCERGELFIKARSVSCITMSITTVSIT